MHQLIRDSFYVYAFSLSIYTFSRAAAAAAADLRVLKQGSEVLSTAEQEDKHGALAIFGQTRLKFHTNRDNAAHKIKDLKSALEITNIISTTATNNLFNAFLFHSTFLRLLYLKINNFFFFYQVFAPSKY